MSIVSVCSDMVMYGKEFFDGLDFLIKSGADAIEFWKWSDKDFEKLKGYKIHRNGIYEFKAFKKVLWIYIKCF